MLCGSYCGSLVMFVYGYKRIDWTSLTSSWTRSRFEVLEMIKLQLTPLNNSFSFTIWRNTVVDIIKISRMSLSIQVLDSFAHQLSREVV